MEDKVIEVFKKYSKSVDTEYNVYNCLIEEDWSNIAQELVKLFCQPAVVGRSEQLFCPECKSDVVIKSFPSHNRCTCFDCKAEWAK